MTEPRNDEISFIKKYRQQILYFSFAALMITLNYFIQWLNVAWISGFIEEHLGHIGLVQKLYLSTEPYDMTELVGSVVAVGVTYVVKFALDKFVVFQKRQVDVRETSKEFSLYFGFAILTTVENLAIQFIMSNFFNSPLLISILVALTIGYITKFFLDRKYVFQKEDEEKEEETEEA